MLISGKQHGGNSVTHLFPAAILVFSFTNGNRCIDSVGSGVGILPKKRKKSGEQEHVIVCVSKIKP